MVKKYTGQIPVEIVEPKAEPAAQKAARSAAADLIHSHIDPALASFENDPATTPFQKAYLRFLVELKKELKAKHNI